MHTVNIEGDDLEYFKTVVGNALDGGYGTIHGVVVTVHNNGQLQFALNDEYATRHFGTPPKPLVPAEPTDSEGFPPQGHGNPYRNVEDGDPVNVYARLDRLERFAANVAGMYNLVIPPLET